MAAFAAGVLVKPAKRTGLWRLGVVERVTGGGKVIVRAYVAPAMSYEGAALAYPPDELAVVTRAKVAGMLEALRAEIASKTELADQIVKALAASSGGTNF